MGSRGKMLLGDFLLLIITIAWGSSFIILKNTIDSLPLFFVLGFRFLVSSILLLLIFIKRISKANKKVVFHGIVLGLTLTGAYIVQTLGLKYTTAGRNAFLTTFYCIIVPFFSWFLLRKKPKIYNFIAAIVYIVGIGFVAISGDKSEGSNMLLGDFLTLGCSVFYALQFIFSTKYQNEGDDSIVLLVLELLVVGVVCSLVSLCYELPTYGIQSFKMSFSDLLPILYLTIICTLFCQMGQIYGFKFTKPFHATLILGTEAIFGVFFSILIGDEKMSLYTIIGFVIVLSSILFNELMTYRLNKLEKKIEVKEKDNN